MQMKINIIFNPRAGLRMRPARPMHDPSTLYAALFLAGIAAGFLNTMAGGGSLLTLPVLMLLGLPADVANGTNRLSVVSQSMSGVWGFHRAGRLDRGSLGLVLVPTVLGSLIGAVAAANAPKALLKPVLLGTMLLVAAVMLVRPNAVTAPEGSQPVELRRSPAAMLGLFAAGLYGGFLQAGVGFILLSVLGGLLRYDVVQANALKLLCTGLFGGVALSVFVIAGQVVWVPAAVLAVATVCGSLLGVRFALRVRQSVIRWVIFGCVVATCAGAYLKH